MDGFNAISECFLSWLSRSGANINPKMEIADLRQQNAGRGVVSTANIEQDEVLFSIPRSIILSVQNSSFRQQHGDLLSSLIEDPWLSLILVTLYEYGQGSDSNWKPYFDILPSSFDTLIYWSENELEELQASVVVKKIGKKSADQMFEEKIWPIIGSRPEVFRFQGNNSKEEVVQLAHRMGSLIMAYAFDIESSQAREPDEEGYATEDEDEHLPKGMVPLADILNADADKNNARLFYEPDTLVMKAIQPIPKGSEIFNDYGPLPRSDLLRRYGYITDNYTQYDVVEIPLDLVVSTVKDVFKLSDDTVKQQLDLLEEADALEDGYDVPHGDDFNEQFPLELKMLGLVLIPHSSPKFAKQASRGELPKSWFELMHEVFKRRLGQYGTTLDQDTEYLSDLRETLDGGMHDRSHVELKRRAVAVQVRMGEKALLEAALAKLEEEGKKVTSEVAETNGGRKRGAEDENGQGSNKRR
ncbi:SET domain-containing protein [Venturia nashicola]|uniref:SET domain-containing protein n=1 Tax=Venturia nashicola TaxID=86259 RepID=A0A4Z1PNS0_9PEZI|nr:SET domain-containing protein [Venturia nashicola]